MGNVTTKRIPGTAWVRPPIALSSKIWIDIVWGLYVIIMVAPSSPTALTHDMIMPIIIPVLANGSETLKKVCKLFLPNTLAIFSYDLSTDSNAAWLARIINGEATYVWAIIIPNMDWVNSTPGKACTTIDVGPNIPNRRAPLARGGRTSGIMTITHNEFPPKIRISC